MNKPRIGQPVRIHLQEVGGTEEVADGLHATGLVQVIADGTLQIGHSATGSQQRDQMAAGG
jgi:hypothetical protein